MGELFDQLMAATARPTPFERTTVADLWTDPYVSEQMLHFHLDGTLDVSSHRTEFVEAACDWLAREFELTECSRVLDLGCGPGLYTRRLARTGARVTGVDFSARSIAYARERAAEDGLAVEHANADYLDWEPEDGGRFDLITMIMRDYGAMSPSQRLALAGKVERWLTPGGAFVFDVDSIASLAGRTESTRLGFSPNGGFWSAEPYFDLVSSYVYPDEAVTLEKFSIVEAERSRTIYVWTACFDADSLGRELASAGLAVERLLGDVSGRPFDAASAQFAVVARRAEGG